MAALRHPGPVSDHPLTPSCAGLPRLPEIVSRAGQRGEARFLEFFAAQIRNPNTREAYARAVAGFLRWCERRGLRGLSDIQPIAVAAYVEELGQARARPTVKQHLAAIGMLFDWLVTGQVVPSNPAAPVRGPKHVVKQGLTPVLSGAEARALLASIDLSRVIGFRDRALIALMVFAFARVGAAVAMRVRDYYPQGKRWKVRLHEKGGKLHQVVCHHLLEEYLDTYLEAAALRGEADSPLFPTWRRGGRLSSRPMTRNDALRMIKRRARASGLPGAVCCHTFRATGITAYMRNGGTLERAAAIAAHESTRTTQLYNRTSDEVTLDEIERIVLD